MPLTNYENAIARTKTNPSQGEPIIGSGFLVTREMLVTCAHCMDASAPIGQTVTLTFPRWSVRPNELQATLVWFDGVADLALLKLHAPVASDVRYLTLSSNLPDKRAPWESWAFPAPAYNGAHLNGTVAGYDGCLLELDCEQGADSVGGASGGPVLVGDQVVGILSNQLQSANKPVLHKVFAGSLAPLREAVHHLSETLGGFCGKIYLLRQQRKSVKPVPDKEPNADTSHLVYALAAIDNSRVQDARDEIQRFFAQELPDRGGILWSLLGSREFLLCFRDSEGVAKAERLGEKLKRHLRDLGDGGDPFQIINVAKEYTWVDDALTPVKGGTPFPFEDPDQPFDFDTHRTIRAFIHLVGTIPNASLNPHLQRFESVRKMLGMRRVEGREVLHRLSVNITRNELMLELQLPCGYFSELKTLSTALEEVIKEKFWKQKFIAYAVDFMKPRRWLG
jgi:hypothetical protein